MAIVGKSKRGASLLSYGLVVGLISVVALSAVTQIGSQGSNLFDTVGQSLNDVTSGQVGGAAGSGGGNPEDTGCTPGDTVFTTPGGPYSFDLASDGDADCPVVTVLAWGGGGAGAGGVGTGSSAVGGAGGFVSAVLASGVVDAGLQIHVGGGGAAVTEDFTVISTGQNFQATVGSGGGGSAVLNSVGSEIIVAGGGGGASNLRGGNGGGNSSGTGGIAAEDAPDCDSGNAQGGHGGSVSAPGAGGVGSRRNGQAGSGRNGGDGTSPNGVYDNAVTVGYGTGGAGYGFRQRDDFPDDGDNGGGGGGGGWFGGGGGGGSPAGCGGGGGASYRDASLTDTGSSVRGSGTTAAGMAKVGYITGASAGGSALPGTDGGDGLVIIRWSE
ncbi:MAG: hypothetical protein Alpg2KO_18710 [Alphaproteobacteria bacterium]